LDGSDPHLEMATTPLRGTTWELAAQTIASTVPVPAAPDSGSRARAARP
jgi:hypothetical protein